MAQQMAYGWLERHGETAINAFGTVFIWAGAAHALYLAATPKQLQLLTTQRAAPFARRLALGGLLTVGVYDILQSTRLNDEQAKLQEQYHQLLQGMTDV